jgi:hypothetical protein
MINIDDEENVDWLHYKLPVTITELFNAAGLYPCGPVQWNVVDALTETSAGVYVVGLVSQPDQACNAWETPHFDDEIVTNRWNRGQPAIYIGRTSRSLRRRLTEFYRHQHGQARPHRGGQDVKLLTCALWVYWAATSDPAIAEDKMIEHFRSKVGRLPFANRVRSARVSVTV